MTGECGQKVRFASGWSALSQGGLSAGGGEKDQVREGLLWTGGLEKGAGRKPEAWVVVTSAEPPLLPTRSNCAEDTGRRSQIDTIARLSQYREEHRTMTPRQPAGVQTPSFGTRVLGYLFCSFHLYTDPLCLLLGQLLPSISADRSLTLCTRPLWLPDQMRGTNARPLANSESGN